MNKNIKIRAHDFANPINASNSVTAKLAWCKVNNEECERIGQLLIRSDRLAAIEKMIIDDPNWIAEGISDDAVEAGINAWDQANRDLRDENYIPGVTADWDEGMIVAAIFKAVCRKGLEEAQIKEKA